MSSSVAPISSAMTPSPISDSACGATMCIPSSRSLFASPTSLSRPFALVHRARAAARRERKLTDAHLVAGGFRLLFGEADRCHFGIGVDAVRNGDRIEGRGLVAGDHLRRDHALFHRAMREQRRAGDVADREDVGHFRALLLIGGDEAFVVGRESGRGEIEVVGDRTAADGDERHVELARLVFAAVPSPLNVARAVSPLRFSSATTFVLSMISTPCFLRMRPSVLPISRSVPVRICGIISTTKTSAPKRPYTVANSRPITPPPMTSSFLGTRSSLTASSELMIDFAVARPRLDVDRRGAGRDHDVLGLDRSRSRRRRV